MDVVWLKKDVRLHDHAPLSLIATSDRPCMILYLYEPDQLSSKTVHGSHVAFCNEGLVELDSRLSGRRGDASAESCCGSADGNDVYGHQFQCITVCHAGAAYTLQSLHKQRPIRQILAHMETGHLKSFARDKAVRRWCRSNDVPIREFNQTGVTRCLSHRDDFTKKFNAFLDQKMPKTPTAQQLIDMRQRLVNLEKEGVKLHGRCFTPIRPSDMKEIPLEHRNDRNQRQVGGEGKAFEMLQSFLSSRGANYSSGISSPNTSWTTCSRLSPYLTWGHISLRHVINATKRRQEELRAAKKAAPSAPSPWLRSLASFQSRMHWRSHFMQKLETQPSLEEQDQCLAFSHLRRQPGDFRQEHYDAWCRGRTGFPFVDACMRCLLETGWLNFRMRAMLVSFATYNLWLDWKRIAGHLARTFLDYEPGIHYPQLQMQAGTTGINAMRVYNVTKQAQDQDPNGVFIRKYVPELQNVPDQYIHEPGRMPVKVQSKCRVCIGSTDDKAKRTPLRFEPIKQYTCIQEESGFCYPSPIIDEKASAKAAKDKLSAVRKKESTKVEAQQVFERHGSRRRGRADRDGATPKALSSSVKRVKIDRGQTSLFSSWSQASPTTQKVDKAAKSEQMQQPDARSDVTVKADANRLPLNAQLHTNPEVSETGKSEQMAQSSQWACSACTFLNDKPLALACSICGSERK